MVKRNPDEALLRKSHALLESFSVRPQNREMEVQNPKETNDSLATVHSPLTLSYALA